MSKKFYVYELISSLDDKVFYVGKGTGNRMYRHEKLADAQDKPVLHRLRKIKKIKNDGGSIIYRKVLETDRESEAFVHEKAMIELYGRKDIGTGTLTNQTCGGDGGNTYDGMSEKQREDRQTKRQITLKNRSDDEKAKTRKIMSTKAKEHWNENRELLKISMKYANNVKRDKKAHAKAVSDGWNNRSTEDKIKTKELKSRLMVERISCGKGKKDFQKCLKMAHEASSYKIMVTDNKGIKTTADSVNKWCYEYCEPYNLNHTSTHYALCQFLKGWNPAKWSKWFGWTVKRV